MLNEESNTVTHRPNSFQTPNHLIDQLLDRLSGNEFKVLMYVMRLTYGFHRRRVSFSQRELEEGRSISGHKVDHGVGISRRRVGAVISSLVAKGLLKVTKGDRAAGQSDTYELADPLPYRHDLDAIGDDDAVENLGTQRPHPRYATSLPPRDTTSLPPGTQRPHNRNTDLRNPEEEIQFMYSNARTRETPQHEPDHDPTSVQLDDFQKEDVLLSYTRELGKDRAQWALTRGVELLEAWLVKRDPNTNRYNYESVQKAHHGKILKGWVLRELQKEISSQRASQKLSGGNRRNGTAQKSTGWGQDEKTNRILDEMFGPIEPVDITNA